MKRVGHLYEKMISLDNCIAAEVTMAQHKKNKCRRARKIFDDPEPYALVLHEKLSSGTYEFHESRARTIRDSYKGKERNLLVPNMEDQAAQQAWLLVAEPYIMRHNYAYNCASIPGGGQTKATDKLRRELKSTNYTYGMTTDIHHFYETLPHALVLRGLRRMFKDEKFIDFAARMMRSMSETGVGIAIGHPASHWLANVALSELDHKIEHGNIYKGRSKRTPRLVYVRYMDDMAFLCSNKRYLHRVLDAIKAYIEPYGMCLKHTHQIFRIADRGLTFLSYRFFHRYTILTKRLMYRISRKMRRAQGNLSPRMARSVMAYYGILKHCDSYNFRMQHVYPYINFNTCRKVISIEDRKLFGEAA